jgi:hypothetical protein
LPASQQNKEVTCTKEISQQRVVVVRYPATRWLWAFKNVSQLAFCLRVPTGFDAAGTGNRPW